MARKKLTKMNNSKPYQVNEFSLGFSQEHLIKLATWKMPFGKYAGQVLIDLPEEYLFWFEKNDFPAGELGELLKFCLDLKIEGLDGLIKKLK